MYALSLIYSLSYTPSHTTTMTNEKQPGAGDPNEMTPLSLHNIYTLPFTHTSYMLTYIFPPSHPSIIHTHHDNHDERTNNNQVLGILMKCGARTFLKRIPSEVYPPIFPLVRCFEREFLRRAKDHRDYVQNDIPMRVQKLYLELMNKFGTDPSTSTSGGHPPQEPNLEKVAYLHLTLLYIHSFTHPPTHPPTH